MEIKVDRIYCPFKFQRLDLSNYTHLKEASVSHKDLEHFHRALDLKRPLSTTLFLLKQSTSLKNVLPKKITPKSY
jgi:hypothetical protein